MPLCTEKEVHTPALCLPAALRRHSPQDGSLLSARPPPATALLADPRAHSLLAQLWLQDWGCAHCALAGPTPQHRGFEVAFPSSWRTRRRAAQVTPCTHQGSSMKRRKMQAWWPLLLNSPNKEHSGHSAAHKRFQQYFSPCCLKKL